ncbi:MAG: HNH endonuclease [Syntrophobacteraceae bacterium]
MEYPENRIAFTPTVPPEVVRREKEAARKLRKSQWWQRQVGKGVCHYCRKTTSPKDLTMDHIVPLIRGGRSTRGNVAPACKECNNRKKYLLPVECMDNLGAPSNTSTREGKSQDRYTSKEVKDERM